MGFAAGFQAGSSAVERGIKMREEQQERERIKAAMGLTVQEMQQRQATPDELGRARSETQALAAQDAEMFGLTPQEQAAYAPQMPVEGQRIGLSRYQVGQQTFDQMPTQAELQALRYGAAADVIAERDPIAAQRMRQEITLARRAEELYPLQRQALEQQTQLGGIQLTDAQTKQTKQATFDTGLADIYKQKFEKPEERTTAILDLVEKTQGPKARMELENSYTAGELNRMNLDAAKFQKGFQTSFTKGVDATMSWLDEQNPGFTLARQGNQIIQTNLDGTKRVFAKGDDNAIMEQFAGMASPANFLTLAKNITDRQKSEELIKIEREKAQTTKNYYESKTGLDRMGAATYFTGNDGNTYASIPTMGKGGLTTETIKINPDNIKFQRPGTEGKGADMKPGKVADEGEKATIAGQLRIADGLGNWVPAGPNGKPLGVLPSERAKFLEKADLPTNLIPQIPWNTNGTEVMFGGKAYDVRNPADMKELKADYKRLGANTIAVEEEQKNFPRTRPQGIVYDPYGASQRPRMGATQAEIDAFNARQAMLARSREIAQRQTSLYNQQQQGLE